MISQDDVRELRNYQAGPEGLILSLYVDVDQSKAVNLNRGFETVADNMLRLIAQERELDGGKMKQFEAERSGVRRFLSEYTPRGKGLVIFSDRSQQYWWQRETRVDIKDGARWSPRPWVRPLLEILQNHDHLCVVLIDQHRARLLTLDAAGWERLAEIESEVPNKHHTTGTDHIWSQSQMDRDRQNHVKSHVRRVAEQLAEAFDRLKPSRLVVGGSSETVTLFLEELPKRLQSEVIGSLAVPVDINLERLRSEIHELQAAAEHLDEVKLVDSLITSARKQDRAALGIKDTLSAVQEARIFRLIVCKSFRAAGSQCCGCGVLTVDGNGQCPYCGDRLDPAPDLINLVSHKVMEQHGKVDVISGEAEGKLMEAGGVGAVLRF